MARYFTRALALLASALLISATRADQLTLVNGKSIKAEIASISEDGLLVGTGIEGPLELHDLRRIRRGAKATEGSTLPIAVELAGGGRLNSSGVTLANESCEVIGASAKPIKLSIDDLRAVRFHADTEEPTFEKAIQEPSAKLDRIFVRDDDQIRMFQGLLFELSNEQVEFAWKGRERAIPRKSLFGIVFASVGGDDAPTSVTTLKNGSRLPGNVISLREGMLRHELLNGTAIELPWDSVATMEIRSNKLTFLSDLEPVDFEQRPIVTLPQEWGRDKNVMGKALKLHDPLTGTERTFSKGLGTHSYTRLAFAVGGAYQKFTATIGIDAGTERRGDCIFRVMGDDRELFTQRVTGADAPRDVEFSVVGVQKLTLIVEPGEDLDLADRANWCDARLIREKKRSN